MAGSTNSNSAAKSLAAQHGNTLHDGFQCGGKSFINFIFGCKIYISFRFSIRSARFIDGYQKGLNGTQAAWAIRKYRGHRVLPEYIMKEFDDSHSSL